jgi:hypothetical protein
MLCKKAKLFLKIFPFALISYFPTVIGVLEKSQVEDLCVKCVENGTAAFIKLVWIPTANPEYFCRENPHLVSKFGIVVERVCDQIECVGIHGRPIMQAFSRHELSCRNDRGIDYITNSDHLYVLELVRDYIEILFMTFIVCVMFYLGKSNLNRIRRPRIPLVKRGDPEWSDPVSM